MAVDAERGSRPARPLVHSGLIAGIDVTIYNPSLDTDDYAAGRMLRNVVEAILT